MPQKTQTVVGRRVKLDDAVAEAHHQLDINVRGKSHQIVSTAIAGSDREGWVYTITFTVQAE